jgi:hypothetical protein
LFAIHETIAVAVNAARKGSQRDHAVCTVGQPVVVTVNAVGIGAKTRNLGRIAKAVSVVIGFDRSRCFCECAAPSLQWLER